jgi:hypothetical protein
MEQRNRKRGLVTEWDCGKLQTQDQRDGCEKGMFGELVTGVPVLKKGKPVAKH